MRRPGHGGGSALRGIRHSPGGQECAYPLVKEPPMTIITVYKTRPTPVRALVGVGHACGLRVAACDGDAQAALLLANSIKVRVSRPVIPARL